MGGRLIVGKYFFMTTIVCECGAEMLNMKSGVLFIWKNGSKQYCDRWQCMKCDRVVYTGFGEHVGHKINKVREMESVRYYQETGEFIYP